MTITIVKDSNNNIIKKNISFTLNPTTANGSLKLFNNVLDVTNIPIGDQLIPVDAGELKSLISTPGTVIANKVAVANAGRNIYGFNEIHCSKLLINNKEIKTSSNTVKIESPYLNYLVPGYAAQSKIMSVDINKDIKNLNSVNTKYLNVNDKDILYSPSTKTYSDNIIKKLTLQSNLGQNLLEIEQINIIIAYNNYISKSTNLGYSWEQIHLTDLDNTTIQKLVCNDNLDLYIIIGMNANIFKVLYSYDLNNWAQSQSLTITNGSTCDLIWALDKFIYLCSSNLDLIKSSIDGINWVDVDHGIDNVCKIIWNGDVFIIINNTSDIYFTSDLINYEITTVGNDNWKYMSEWGELGVVLSGVNNLAFSNDLINWSIIPLEIQLTRIEYNINDNYFIGTGLNKIKLSYDGINWIDVTNTCLNMNYNFKYSNLLCGFYNLQSTNQANILNVKKIITEESPTSSLYNIENLNYNIRDIQYSKSNNSFLLISEGNLYSTTDMNNFNLFIDNSLGYDWSLFCHIDKYNSIVIIGDSANGNISSSTLTGLDSNPFVDNDLVITDVEMIGDICLTTSSGGTFYTIDGNISYSINNKSTRSPILINNKIILLNYTTTASTLVYYIEKLDNGYSTETTTIPSGVYKSAAWSGQKCVAVGINVCAYTVDGITWLEGSIPNADWTDIVWINNMFIALNTNNTNCLSYSKDGNTWNEIETPFGGVYQYKKGLVYEPFNNELYIHGSYKLKFNKKKILNMDMFDSNKDILTKFNSFALNSSNNGVNWNSICYGADLYILVGTNKISYSNKLDIWTTTTLTGNWNSICYGSSKYVVVGSNLIAYSSNGISWSTINKDGSWKYVCYGASMYITVGINTISYSLNGINWSNIVKTGDWKCVCYFLNKFIIVGNNIFGYSTNGITWKTFSKIGDWKSVTYSCNLFVAVGNNLISYSSDGINWIDINKTGNWKSINWSVDLNLFIAVGNGIISKSHDSINWIDIISENNNWNSIIWAKRLGIFITVGDNNKAHISNLCINSIDNTLNMLDYNSKSLNLGINNNDEGLAIKSNNTIKLINSSNSNDYVEINADQNKLDINADTVNINKLAINNIPLNSTAANLNLLKTTPGTISNGTEACVVNDNLDIININALTTDNILINNNVLLSTSDNSSSKITNATNGTANANTVLITDSNNNITGLNNTKVNSLTIEDVTLVNPDIKISDIKLLSNIKAHNNYPTNIDIKSLEYSPLLDLFVSVGNGINISNDGIVWRQILGINNNINHIYWDLYYNIFIASAENGLLISSNGEDWKFKLFTNNWISTTSNNNGTIVSISNSDKLMYTLDNITWSTITIVNRNWSSICYGASTFVAVGSISSTTSIMYSDDGINWLLPITYISKLWQSICYYSGKFIAVGNLGVIGISTNGIDWNYPSSPTINNHKCVKYTNIGGNTPMFVIVSDSGANDRLLKSTDGYNWTIINTTSIELNYKSLASNSNRIIFGGFNSTFGGFNSTFGGFNSTFGGNGLETTKVSYTNDLINFSLVSTCYDINHKSIIWISELNMFIAIGEKNKRIMYSYNGKDWEFGIIPSLNQGLNSICWSGSLLIVTSYKYIYKSTDGINWSIINTFVNDNKYYTGCCYGNSKFIVVNNSTSGNNIYYSSDAVTWSGIEVSTKNLHNIIWSNNLSKFIIISENNVLTSTNGTTWNTTNNSINSINIFEFTNLIISTGTSLYKSSNGTSWNKINTNIEFSNLHKIDFIDSINKYMGICKIDNKTTYILSEDLITWDTYLCTFDNNYNSIIWANNILIVYGYTFSNPGYPFLTLNYNEFLNKIDTENYEINLNINENTSIINNWNSYTNNTYSFEGSVYWSNELNLFINTIGKTASLVSNNSLYYSKDGYVWESSSLTARVDKLAFGSNTIKALHNNLYSSSDLNETWSIDANTYNYISYIKHLDIYIAAPSSASNLIKVGKNNITIPSSILINCIGYNSNIIVALPNSGTTFITSTNGYDWVTRTLSSSAGNWISICYSTLLRLFIAVSSSGTIIKSADGITWVEITISNSYNRSSVIWVDDLEIYIITSSTSSTNPLSYSTNGTNWVDVTFANSISIYSIAWSNTLKMFIINCGNGSYMLSKKTIIGIGNLIPTTNLFNYNEDNGNLSIGSNKPTSYQLQVDGIAAKPTSTTWIVASDERLKENIVNADLDICYDIVKNLRLTKYKLKDKVQDQLGWIAQEVEKILPKSVTQSEKYGYKDFKSLNSDQIITAMYGTTQKLFNEYEKQTKELKELYDSIVN